MEPVYVQVYQNHSMNYSKLVKEIALFYTEQDLHKPLSYDEILFKIDNRWQKKCDRSVAQSIFKQAVKSKSKCSLMKYIEEYVEMVQTVKLLILRNERNLVQITNKLSEMKPRKKTYVYLQMLQATIYSRFSKVPSFQYRILPTDIPPVAIVNSINPVLNQQFTFELEVEKFRVVFYQSGVQISSWTFPQQPLSEGQYIEIQTNPNLQFKVKIKYLPKGKTAETIQGQKQKQRIEENIKQGRNAFRKLCTFQPFLSTAAVKEIQPQQRNIWWKLTNLLIQCLPFFSAHLRVLHAMLLLLLLFQCIWPMQNALTQICGIFYVISFIYDCQAINCGITLISFELLFVLLIIKSIWIFAVKQLKPQQQLYSAILMFTCIAIKALTLLCLWICQIRAVEIPQQRLKFMQVTAYKSKQERLNNIWDLTDY